MLKFVITFSELVKTLPVLRKCPDSEKHEIIMKYLPNLCLGKKLKIYGKRCFGALLERGWKFGSRD